MCDDDTLEFLHAMGLCSNLPILHAAPETTSNLAGE